MALFIELLLRDLLRSFVQTEFVAYSNSQLLPVCFPFSTMFLSTFVVIVKAVIQNACP